LNPFVIFLDSVWGAFDVIPAFFFFWGYINFIQKNYTLSAISLGLGISYKIFPVLSIPFILLLMQKNNLPKFIFSLIFTIIIIFLPFILTNPAGLVDAILYNGRRGVGWEMHIWTFFNVLKHFYPINIDFSQKLLYWNVKFPVLIFFFFYIFLLYLFYRFKNKKHCTISYFLTPILLFYILYHWVTPSFVVWSFPFLLILFRRNMFSKIALIYISLVGIFVELAANQTYHTISNVYFSIHLPPMDASFYFFVTACGFIIIWLLTISKLIKCNLKLI